MSCNKTIVNAVISRVNKQINDEKYNRKNDTFRLSEDILVQEDDLLNYCKLKLWPDEVDDELLRRKIGQAIRIANEEEGVLEGPFSLRKERNGAFVCALDNLTLARQVAKLSNKQKIAKRKSEKYMRQLDSNLQDIKRELDRICIEEPYNYSKIIELQKIYSSLIETIRELEQLIV